MPDTPEISVIVPVYNVEKYIRRSLDSILSQTFTDWECILVDDGTPDNSGKICDEYAARDSRFVVIHKENGGVSSARNAGLDVARGEWICFCDSDDWCDSSMLEDLFESANECNANVIIGGYWLNDGTKEYAEKNPPARKLTMPKDFATEWQGPWAKLIKKSVLHKNKIRFPEGISLAEDLYFTFNLYFFTDSIYGISKPYYHYYQNKESACHSISIKNIADEVEVIKKIEEILKTHSVEKEWTAFLENRKRNPKNRCLVGLKPARPDLWRTIFPENNFKMLMTSGIARVFVYLLIIMRLDKFVIFLLKRIYKNYGKD